MPKFYTKRGELTRYGLACGYIEKRGTDESYVVLEQISSNGALRVHGGGRWLRSDIWTGDNLKEARRVFRAFDHVAASKVAEAEYLATPIFQ